MSNLLQHPEFGEIRVEKQGADYIFCAKDVCDALELDNVTNAIAKLDKDEYLTLKILKSGQKRDMLFVTESGLYALIIRSNKPMARKFRMWITGEVLPALRKYGTYSLDEKVTGKVKRICGKKTVSSLRDAIKRGLSATDRRIVARQCRTDEYDVADVLSGRKEDAYMMAVLYGRATGNQLLRKSFYTPEGAERLLAELTENRDF